MFGVACLLAIALIGSNTAVAGGGCHVSSDTSDAAGTAVSLKNCGFAPVTLRAPVGAAITWTNNDYVPHGIHGLGWGLTAMNDVVLPGGTYSHKFEAPGIYPYMCYVHPGMSGVVIVGDVATAPAGGAPPAMIAAATESAPSPALPAALGIGGFIAGFAFASLRRSRTPRAILEARSVQPT